MGKMKQFPKVRVVSMRLTDEEYTKLKKVGNSVSDTLRAAVLTLLACRQS